MFNKFSALSAFKVNIQLALLSMLAIDTKNIHEICIEENSNVPKNVQQF